MGLFATKNKGDLETVKKELISVVNSFFVPYKANSVRIINSINVLKGSILELDAFKKKLDSKIDREELFPEIISEEEKKAIEDKLWKEKKLTQEDIDFSSILEKELSREITKKSEFGRILDDLRTYMNGTLTIALTNYELHVVKPLKEFIDVLNSLINKLTKEIRKNYRTIDYTSSQFDALKELLSYVLEYIHEFEEDSQSVFSGIINQKKYTVVEGQTKFKPIRATTLLDDYNGFLRENKDKIKRLNDNLKLLTDGIKLLNKETIRLIKSL